MDSEKLAVPASLEGTQLDTLAVGEPELGEALDSEHDEPGTGEPSGAEPDREREHDDVPDAAPAPAGSLSEADLERGVAALLFASPEPLGSARLAALLAEPDVARIEVALAHLAERLSGADLPYELRSIAGGWQLYTSPDVEPTVARLAKARREEKVSPASLETLSVVAYRQPVTKAEIEAIRGVQVGPILRALVDRGLVRVSGRSDVPGHPLLYATTKKFLDTFGLARLEDLPRDGELLRD